MIPNTNVIVTDTSVAQVLKAPGLFDDYKAWRITHGLTSDEIEVYVKAVSFRDAITSTLLMVVMFFIGKMIGMSSC